MKNVSVIVVGGLMFFMLCPLAAQTQTQSRGTQVALVDVGKVFREHLGFKQRIDLMKEEVDRFEQYIRQEQAKLAAMAEQLKDLQPGTPAYRVKETEVAQASTDLQVAAQLKKKEFIEAEAKIYYDTYVEVQSTVAAFAKRHGIDIVRRFNSDPIQPDDRTSVLQGISNDIIFQQSRDITSHILSALNSQYNASNPRGSVPQR